MLLLVALLGVVLLVSYANGANDNFKGVATLFGSDTADYRKALAWGTACTAAGSIAAAFFAERLVHAFTGAGLVPDSVAGTPAFVGAVALGAGAAVLAATRLSLPVSTTHAIVGALLGAGLVLAGGDVRIAVLGAKFVLPLIASPVAALVATMLLYHLLRTARRKLGISRADCVCVGRIWVPVIRGQGVSIVPGGLQVELCRERYTGTIFSLDAHRTLNGAHYFSAGAVSFARGLNDTPKIVALLVAASVLGIHGSAVLVGVAMALGGLLGARRVAETMARRITPMNHGQGFTANLVTAGLVIAASPFGLPVSTTHVSCGALFGIGMVTREARWSTIGKILLAWIGTLPIAAAIAGLAAWIL